MLLRQCSANLDDLPLNSDWVDSPTLVRVHVGAKRQVSSGESCSAEFNGTCFAHRWSGKSRCGRSRATLRTSSLQWPFRGCAPRWLCLPQRSRAGQSCVYHPSGVSGLAVKSCPPTPPSQQCLSCISPPSRASRPLYHLLGHGSPHVIKQPTQANVELSCSALQPQELEWNLSVAPIPPFPARSSLLLQKVSKFHTWWK